VKTVQNKKLTTMAGVSQLRKLGCSL